MIALKQSELVAIQAALVATIFDLLPNFFPLFSPSKGPIANNTKFGWQMFFLHLFHFKP